MLLSLLGCIVATLLVTFGLAWPLVARCAIGPGEKLVAAAGLSLVGVFVVAWTVYVFALPLVMLWVFPPAAFAGIWFAREAAVAAWRDPLARGLITGQLLIIGWCLAWLATITSYSGGGWAADWFEHWERTRFFLERGPLDYRFIDQYALTARPPLANVVTGVFVYLTRVDFAHYQVVSTVLGSLVFLPAALFTARIGRPALVPFVTLAFMLNPMFVQNATFAWTKLPAAFLVLAAVWFFVRARDPGTPQGDLMAWSGTLLAGGVLAHYSAAPYVVALALVWAWQAIARKPAAAWWQASAGAVITGTIVLSFWFLWAVRVYGADGTFLSNTSATSAHMREGSQLVKIAANIFDTLVPHFVRPLDTALIAQRSLWGACRDWFFQSYQVNLLLAFGSVAGVVVVREALRARRETTADNRRFWRIFLVAAVVLGIAAHGARDHWGLAHICLQPVVLLGLGFLAGRWDRLSRGWRAALIAGAAVDFVFGIGLHFGVQSHAIDRWFGAGGTFEAIAAGYNPVAVMNAGAKLVHRLAFLRDALGGAAMVAPIVALAVLVAAVARVARLKGKG